MGDFFQFDETLERTREPHDVSGFKVHTTDGHIGEVAEFSDEPGRSYLIVNVGRNLFSGSRQVMLPAGMVERIDRNDKEIHVNCTKDEVKHAPPFDADRFAHPEYHQELERHYVR